MAWWIWSCTLTPYMLTPLTSLVYSRTFAILAWMRLKSIVLSLSGCTTCRKPKNLYIESSHSTTQFLLYPRYFPSGSTLYAYSIFYVQRFDQICVILPSIFLMQDIPHVTPWYIQPRASILLLTSLLYMIHNKELISLQRFPWVPWVIHLPYQYQHNNHQYLPWFMNLSCDITEI